MPTAQLGDRAAILIDGPDAEHFLQNILTVDLDRLEPGEARPGALLSPQGKILFDFLISRRGEAGFLLDCRADAAGDFVRRLMLYRLRAKAEISVQDHLVVAARWQDDSASSHADSGSSQLDSSWLADRRFTEGAGVLRHYGEAVAADASPDDFTRLRIAHGVAEAGADFAAGDAFPHDVLMDENGGVGFHKGCYVGQEVVSRMQHRGTTRKRVVPVEGDAPLTTGVEVKAGELPIGPIGSVDGVIGLALLRLDRAEEAASKGTPLTAGDVTITLHRPAFAQFEVPAALPA
ncbi:MAG: folate-binding protein YgfZ [Aquamicrobium sp.]|nr:folate-binding protein YgfZ [Aquamicrobium sp.]